MKNPSISKKHILALAAAVAAGGFLGLNRVEAASTRTWSGSAGSTDWATTANWGATGLPVSGDSLVFTNANTSSSPLTNTLTSSSFSIASITFSALATAYTMTGNTFTMVAITNNGSNLETFSNAGGLSGASGTETFTVKSGGGNIAVTGGLINTDAAIQTLTVSGANGLVTLGGYTLENNGTTGRADVINGTGNMTINGAVVNGTGAGSGLTYNGSGTLTLSGMDTYTGATGVNTGTLTLDFSALGAPATNIVNNGLATGGSGLVLGGGTLDVMGTTSATNSQRFNGLTLSGSSSTSAIVLLGNTTSSPLALILGGITRNAGSALDITEPTGTLSTTNGVQTTAGTASKILTSAGVAYATVGGSDWAAKDSSNAFIVGLSSISGGYTLSTTTTLSGNADVASGVDTTLGADTAITSLRFNQNEARTITATGFTLTVGGILETSTVNSNVSSIVGGTLKSAAISASLDLPIIQNNASDSMAISSSIVNASAGATALSKIGLGILTLTGNNTYTGGTLVTGGTVFAGSNTAFGDSAGKLTLGLTTGATTTVTLSTVGSSDLSFANQLVINKATTVTIAGTNAMTFTGGLDMVSGTTNLVNNDTKLVTIGGSIFQGTVAGYHPSYGGSGSTTLIGNISGADSLTDAVTGSGVLTLSGANTYAGGTTVNAGSTLALGSSSTSASTGPVGSAGLTLNGGATAAVASILEAVNGPQSISNVVTLTGGSFLQIGGSQSLTFNGAVNNTGGNGTNLAITNSGTTTFAGGFALRGATAVNLSLNGTGDVTFSAPITSTSSANTFILNDSGLVTLSGANTYTYATTIAAGTVNLGIAQNGTTSGPLGASGTITLSGGTLQFSAANTNVVDYSARFATAAGQQYKIDTNGQSVTFGTALTSSTGNLAVSDTAGNGNLILTGTNTYSGATTITGGTLTLASAGSINGTSGLTLNGVNAKFLNNSSVAYTKSITISQGTIGGMGTISAVGGVAIGSNAIVSPGNSPAIQNYTTGMTFGSGGTYKWEIDNATGTAGANYDQLAVTNIGTPKSVLNVTATAPLPFTIDITGLNAADASGVVPNFNNANSYAWLIATSDSLTNYSANEFSLNTADFANNNSLGGGSFAIHIGTDGLTGLDGNANDLFLTFTPSAVPEPASLALLGLGAAALLTRRRRV